MAREAGLSADTISLVARTTATNTISFADDLELSGIFTITGGDVRCLELVLLDGKGTLAGRGGGHGAHPSRLSDDVPSLMAELGIEDFSEAPSKIDTKLQTKRKPLKKNT